MSKAYREAGVDLQAGYEAVERIKRHVERTRRPGVLGSLGGFGGLFELPWERYQQPVLVSGTDGVGTKLKLAFELERHDTVGIDLVAMCVNDIVVQGAEPLFFLDYLASGRLDPSQVAAVVKGIADGCLQAGCALIGGETAEMPGFYPPGEYDLAGFSVGIVEKEQLITGQRITPGDMLIGLPSSGVHSNGFSLVRKMMSQTGLKLTAVVDSVDSGRTIGEVLLTPTRIYVQPVLALLKQFTIKGMAHITGGGMIENIPRMLPPACAAVIEKGSWPVLPVFRWLQEAGQLTEEDMFNTFNMGIGLVLAVSLEETEDVLKTLRDMGEEAYVIGRIITGRQEVYIGGGHHGS
ncbi:phosphoribosylformylglycinamidine cyclo-ligase [Caldalkalibacillus thermarum TA2.A1]|uniref:Phosphoribosylformylglycinamidine cyclo-ligase n=1 Tax=Caldalkalibacillus thermarum (strain TA2.A1) TaxID=986075 RepID=F5L5A7_CALTT|nr:phosphoribosylformylglycinamidine cyclo-ligase [Caldalkalibacillus thermarum]EGL83475.1 phosphoribosylformylglycinamidine cyclo-ligase [Caldalkalibacillus thermarum TA2.A1]QZT34617.1 phosphoribosylformylglycinamidine cyclo-ligase [Caldalkalibacillus thermarum TA2.A1]